MNFIDEVVSAFLSRMWCRRCGAELAPDVQLAELHVCRIVIV